MESTYVQNYQNLKKEPNVVIAMKKMEEVYQLKDEIVLYKIKTAYDKILSEKLSSSTS
jgi:hypothetical protein